MGHIFISYSHKDKEYVHGLADALKSEGFDVWIDDRIDYGTRWPLVIESAIDSCEVFVLVASNSSHESEWVQHEFVRAQRLQKQIFPLLLNGDPWLSFESTQYFDVRHGDFPSSKFYDNLRKNLNEQLRVSKQMLIETWPVYINRKYGFSINYPMEGTILYDGDDDAKIGFPRIESTNLKEKYITINCNETGVVSSPLSYGHPPFESYSVEILGQKFLRESDFDGAAGTIGEWTSYSSSRGNKVVTVSMTLITTSHHAYFPQLLTRIDLNWEKEALLYTLSTFSWMDEDSFG